MEGRIGRGKKKRREGESIERWRDAGSVEERKRIKREIVECGAEKGRGGGKASTKRWREAVGREMKSETRRRVKAVWVEAARKYEYARKE